MEKNWVARDGRAAANGFIDTIPTLHSQSMHDIQHDQLYVTLYVYCTYIVRDFPPPTHPHSFPQFPSLPSPASSPAFLSALRV